ncbi:MAG: hypothetical protein ACO1SV_01875 [Fimbriimonas sp.]
MTILAVMEIPFRIRSLAALLPTLCAVAQGQGGFAYKIADGSPVGGKLVVSSVSYKRASISLQGAPIRWVSGWGGFAVQERDIVFRVAAEGSRKAIYDLAPLIDRIARKTPGKTALSWAYEVDVSPQGDRLALLTRADWSIREIDLRTKRVRLVASGAHIAAMAGQRLRLGSESHCGVRWSPDGNRIAVALPGTEVWGEAGDESESALLVVSRDGRSARRLGSGVPIDWMGRNRLLADFTPEGGDRRELRVYGTSGRLEASRKVPAPLLAAWDGRSVLIAERQSADYSIIRATPKLQILGKEPVEGNPVALTGIGAKGLKR